MTARQQGGASVIPSPHTIHRPTMTSISSAATHASRPDNGGAPSSSGSVFAHGGDTLGDVAKRVGVDEQQLRDANPGLANPDHLLPGQSIQVPAATPDSLRKPPGSCSEPLDAARKAWDDKGFLGRLASPQTGWGESYEINDARIFRRECEPLPQVLPRDELTKRQQALQDHLSGAKPLPPQESLKLRHSVEVLEKAYGVPAKAAPPLTATESQYQENQALRSQNNLSMAALGVFGLPAWATRALGGTERQVAAIATAGAQVMDMAGAHMSVSGGKTGVSPRAVAESAHGAPLAPRQQVRSTSLPPVQATAVEPKAPPSPAVPTGGAAKTPAASGEGPAAVNPKASAIPAEASKPATSGAPAPAGPSPAAGTGPANPNRTVLSPEVEAKILFGRQTLHPDTGKPTNKVIGAHSAKVNNDHPDFVVDVLKTNPDGTKDVKFYKQLPNGELSRLKRSTLFPDSWTDSQVLDAVRKIADTPIVGTRVDPKTKVVSTLHQGTVNGLKIEVIKDNGDVVSGYPAGHKGFQSPQVFENPPTAPGKP